MIKKKNYYSKIYYGYMIALIILCLLIGSVVFYQLITERENHDNMVKTHFETNYRETESKVSMFRDISGFLFEDENVRQYTDKTYTNQYYNRVLVQRAMNTYTDVILNLNMSIAITDMEDVCITTHGSEPFDDFCNRMSISDEFVNKTASMADTSSMFLSEDSPYYVIVFKHRYPSGSTAYSFVSVDKKAFLPIADEKTEFILADKTENMTFDNKNIRKVFKDINPNVRWQDYSKGNVIVRSSQHLNDGVYMCNFSGSIGYVSFAFLAILWIALLFSCKKVANWLATKMYTPIYNILDIFGHDEHGDEIEFLDTSIKKLMHNNQMLTAKLNESTANIRNSFIIDLLYGIAPEDTIEQYISDYRLPYLNSKCLCITFECDYNELKSNITEYGDTHIIQSSYMETLKKILCETMSGEFAVLDKFKFVFLTEDASKSMLKNKLISILEVSEKYYKVNPFIAIGRSVDSIKDIHISFNDTSEILTRKFDYLEKSILFFDDLRTETNIFYYPIELENAMIENILYGDEKKVDTILTEILNTNLYELSLDKDNMTEFKFAITATIKRVIKMMSKSVGEIFGEDNIVYLNIGHSTDKKDIEMNIRNMIHTLCEYKSDSINQKHRKITSDILNYIEENYTRDISLTDISEFFSISPGHVSRILKQDVGIGFKEYLDNIRIEEAKKLLTTSFITVNRIAEKVGCNNVRSFIRTFKNHTGYSPKEFREKENHNS